MLDRKRIFGTHNRIAAWLFTGVVLPTGVLHADDIVPPPAPPQVTLRYRELTNRQDFKFKMLGAGEFAKPVGDMRFDYPTESFPIGGLDPAITSYCVEPLVPMFAGSSYPFTVDTLNRPKFYGDPETVDGFHQTDRRVSFIKELYGKYYQDTLKDPKTAVPAFQAALWELTQEKELPDGPMPFNLFTGSFQANYANVEQAPEFVRQAQTYVQNLSGDEAAFTDNSLFKGTEIVRLTAVRSPEGVIAQSQFVLRNLPITASSGGGGAIGSPGGSGSGSGGSLGGGRGGPLGSGAGGFPGLGGAGFPFIGSPGSSGATTTVGSPTSAPAAVAPVGNVEGPSQQGPSASQPVNNVTPTDTTTSPPPPPSPSSSPPPPPPPSFGPPPPPASPPPPIGPPPPAGPPTTPGVPAPPALLLGALGVGLLALRRAFVRKAERPTTESV